MRSAITVTLGLASSPAALWPVALLSAAVTLLQACGPSFEVIQEGDLRFAHCDRLDLDAEVASSHRLTCWREWRRLYVYGQTRDRIDYAQRRISEIVSGAEGPPFELGGAPPGTTVHVTAPDSPSLGKASNPALRIDTLPATATEPPPAVLPAPSPAATSVPSAAPAAAPVPAAERPGDACAATCAGKLDECREGCTNAPERCPSCEPAFRRCMRTCYR